MRKRLMVTGFVAAAVLLGGCAGGNGKQAAPAPDTAKTPAAESTAAADTQMAETQKAEPEAGGEVNWPTGTVTIFVPGKAGANLDVKARLVAKYLSGELGENVVVENRPGAGGITACTQYLTEEPNTNNIEYMSGSNLSVSPLYNEVEFTADDFILVAGLDSVENGMFVNASLGISTLDELKAYGEGKTIKFASAGVGNDSFLVSKILMEEMGLKSDSINGDGFGDALVACASGTADITYCALNQAAQYVEEGNIIPLAVYSKDDYTGYADYGFEKVPSLVNSGYDINYSAITYFAIRSGTDDAVVSKLEEALGRVYANPDFQKEFTDAGFVMLPDTSAATVQAQMDQLIADVKSFAEQIE